MQWAAESEQREQPPTLTPLADWNAERAARMLSGKVLIVDDDIRIVIALTQLLGRVGMPTVYALNGREGIEALERHPDVSLVLMDIMMPVMDGYEAIKTIRRSPGYANLPIVVLSAKAIPGEREKALDAGANEYLQKPVVDVDRLLKIACDLLDSDATSERSQAAAAEGEPDAKQDAAGPSEPAASQPTRTVLYIEDNPATTTLIARLLTKRPHIRLITADTAREGVDIATTISPDLILLDNRLPDGTGTSVRDQLAATPATAAIPVVIISGDVIGSDADSPDAPLAANILFKPFSIKQFLTTIDQHLP